MQHKNLLIENIDGIAIVTVNRPKVLNALNIETLEDLNCIFGEFASDDAVKAVIVTGAGEKAFVAGADINELAEQTVLSGYEMARRGQTVFRNIETIGKPVVAAINGFALGGGLELALACHIRIASSTAKLGLPEVKLAVIPGYGGTQRLARLVGRGRALELILTGEPIDAVEALRIGLLNRVVGLEDLLDTSVTLLRKMLSNGPVALRLALAAVDRGLDVDLEVGLEFEASLFGILCGTNDLQEGMKAFLEKRAANFKGE